MADDEASVVKKKLLEIDKTIKQLDPAIRSAAFDILAPIYFDGAAKPKTPKRDKGEETVEIDDEDRADFYGKFSHDKPAENVLLVAGSLYSQYGKFPITRADVEAEAASAGVIVPARSDLTMLQSKEKGKSMFRKANKGYELTVHGEARIRELYKVKPGKKPRPDAKEAKK